jgi:hypothetical protein
MVAPVRIFRPHRGRRPDPPDIAPAALAPARIAPDAFAVALDRFGPALVGIRLASWHFEEPALPGHSFQQSAVSISAVSNQQSAVSIQPKTQS